MSRAHRGKLAFCELAARQEKRDRDRIMFRCLIDEGSRRASLLFRHRGLRRPRLGSCGIGEFHWCSRRPLIGQGRGHAPTNKPENDVSAYRGAALTILGSRCLPSIAADTSCALFTPPRAIRGYRHADRHFHRFYHSIVAALLEGRCCRRKMIFGARDVAADEFRRLARLLE